MGYVVLASIRDSLEDFLMNSPAGDLARDIATAVDDVGLAAVVLQELETRLLAKFNLTDSAALKAYLSSDAAKSAETLADALEAAKLATKP